MFENFYRFREKPFQLAPNPDFLFKSKQHERALTYLEYGLTENVGFIVLTGEVGSGKTTTTQYILRSLGDAFEIGLISNTKVTPKQLLELIQGEFEIPNTKSTKVAIIDTINSYLIDQYEARRRVLLVIDEAQNLSAQALEEVRMLSNLQSDHHALLQIMLVGQPELLKVLRSKEMRQFSQRVAVHFHLKALDQNETVEYIDHRVQAAGGMADLFTPTASQRIYELSRGIPRAINLLCQAALVYGFADDKKVISQDIIKQLEVDNIGLGVGTEDEENTTVAEDDPLSANKGKEPDALESEIASLRAANTQLKNLVLSAHNKWVQNFKKVHSYCMEQSNQLELRCKALEKDLVELWRVVGALQGLETRQNASKKIEWPADTA